MEEGGREGGKGREGGGEKGDREKRSEGGGGGTVPCCLGYLLCYLFLSAIVQKSSDLVINLGAF